MSMHPGWYWKFPEKQLKLHKQLFHKATSICTCVICWAVSTKMNSSRSYFPNAGDCRTSVAIGVSDGEAFAEGLSDDKQADAVRDRISWKYALGWS